jgi:hypothetical protein
VAHKLITGTTLSGKTTIARRLAALYTAAGRDVIVLDEMMDPKWIDESGAKFLTDDPQEFLATFWASRNCAVFIDEAGEVVGRYDKAMAQTATRGRHWGHICHYIVQRPALLDKTVVTQCTEAYVFVSEPDDLDLLAKRYLCPAIRDAGGFMQGQYIHVVRFGSDRRPSYTHGDVFLEETIKPVDESQK